MKILVTGVSGQLGSAVMRELAARGHEAIGTARRKPDLQAVADGKVRY